MDEKNEELRSKCERVVKEVEEMSISEIKSNGFAIAAQLGERAKEYNSKGLFDHSYQTVKAGLVIIRLLEITSELEVRLNTYRK